MKEYLPSNQPRPAGLAYFIALAVFSLCYWGLRINYWSANFEEPFSDMADFEQIALRVLHDLNFEHSAFWQSYKAPVLPILGALVYAIFGEHNLLAWRYFQTLLTFAALLWLARELYLCSAKRIWSLGLLFVVAFSKASIFWSFKFATECLAEASVYAIAASWLAALRGKSPANFVLAGFVTGLACLHRPNFLVVYPCVGLLVLFQAWRVSCVPQAVLRLGLLATVSLLVWSPWMLRTYNLYGVPMIGNTSGGLTLIFNLGEITYQHEDGREEKITNEKLLGEAPTRFANDYQAHLFAKKVFMQWAFKHSSEYFEIVWGRIKEMATTDTVSLTRISRQILFTSRINDLLLDKNGWLVGLGVLGLLAFPLIFADSSLFILFLAAVPAWLFGAVFQSTSRMLDPMLPIILFGNLLLAGSLTYAVARIFRKPSLARNFGTLDNSKPSNMSAEHKQAKSKVAGL